MNTEQAQWESFFSLPSRTMAKTKLMENFQIIKFFSFSLSLQCFEGFYLFILTHSTFFLQTGCWLLCLCRRSHLKNLALNSWAMANNLLFNFTAHHEQRRKMSRRTDNRKGSNYRFLMFCSQLLSSRGEN